MTVQSFFEVAHHFLLAVCPKGIPSGAVNIFGE